MITFYLLIPPTLAFGIWDVSSGGNKWIAWLTILASIAYGPLMWLLSRAGKRFSTKQLDPKIIAFTADANDSLLRLSFGDINCFGETPRQMDRHPQYSQLRDLNFRELQILSERPRDAAQRIRYGKLVTDLRGVRMRHYNDSTAPDIGIRGRIKKSGAANVDQVQLYKKIRNDGKTEYEAVEHGVLHSDCTLYVKLWELLWRNADEAAPAEIEDWKRTYSPP